jgi:uncharacterized membrane protein required for colicin V production
MVDVKEAVKSSASYLHSMQAILETSIQNVLLEEVEVSDDAEHWLITLGYDHLLRSSTGFQALANAGFERKYKRFKIDRENGEVESMKNVSI